MMLAAGEIVKTVSGRKTTPFPKIDTATKRKTRNTEKRVTKWLIDNAIAEAKARGDRFNLLQFAAIDLKNISKADKDSAELYLFNNEKWMPDIVPEITRPLIKRGTGTKSAASILSVYHYEKNAVRKAPEKTMTLF